MKTPDSLAKDSLAEDSLAEEILKMEGKYTIFGHDLEGRRILFGSPREWPSVKAALRAVQLYKNRPDVASEFRSFTVEHSDRRGDSIIDAET